MSFNCIAHLHEWGVLKVFNLVGGMVGGGANGKKRGGGIGSKAGLFGTS